MFRLIMLASNAVCDPMEHEHEHEHERGMVRMLIITLLWPVFPIPVLTIIGVA